MSSVLLLKSLLYANAIQKSKKKKKVKKKTSTKTCGLDIKLCRICNDNEGEIPIFDNVIHPNIPEEIENFSGIILNHSEQLPQHMCQRCLDLLNGCILFRELCQKTYRQHIELTVKKESNTFDNEHQIKHDDDEDYTPPSPVLSDNLEVWKCNKCSADFDNLKCYKEHLKDCNKSNKVHESKANSHGTKLQFLCDTCGKTCKSKANLLVHMGIHENIFPFKCEECPYQGRTLDLLKVHKRTHLADKPFKCSQCPKSTTTASNLAKHMRHVHSTSRPYKCSYCDRAFSYQHDMKRHMRDIHLRTSTVECDVCLKKFNTKKILQGHRWKVHKIKGERSGRLPSYLQCQRDGSGCPDGPGAPEAGGADGADGTGAADAAPAPNNHDLNYLLIFKPEAPS